MIKRRFVLRVFVLFVCTALELYSTHIFGLEYILIIVLLDSHNHGRFGADTAGSLSAARFTPRLLDIHYRSVQLVSSEAFGMTLLIFRDLLVSFT